jgi:hypothetical protein
MAPGDWVKLHSLLAAWRGEKSDRQQQGGPAHGRDNVPQDIYAMSEQVCTFSMADIITGYVVDLIADDETGGRYARAAPVWGGAAPVFGGGAPSVFGTPFGAPVDEKGKKTGFFAGAVGTFGAAPAPAPAAPKYR